MSEDPGGGRGLSAARLLQDEEEAGTLRLRHGAVLHRRQPGGVRRKSQGSGSVSAPPGSGPEENTAFWEEEEDGGERLLTDSA